MASELSPANSFTTLPASPKQRVENRLKLIFAIQSCLGGLVLGSADEAEIIPVVAIFFAIFGYLFVDMLGLFALPAIAAYGAMAFVALYSVGQFTNWDSPGQRQMIAVGELLVYVQSILMLQIKTRRIFEQLIVFSLLELIVAAVFNNAIYYGFILIPMTLLAVWALCLLSALNTWVGVDERPQSASDQSVSIMAWSPSTAASYSASVMRYPRIAIVMLGPAVIAVGLIFFYALPRIGDAKRMDMSGQTLVGFSDNMGLGQIGQMLQNPEPALRVTITRRNSIRPYRAGNGIYLRGRVMEIYTAGTRSDQDATWNASSPGVFFGETSVPPQFIPPASSDNDLFDEVDVKVICEPMQSKSLFMIAPYHRIGPSVGLTHSIDAWTTRRSDTNPLRFPRISYEFGSAAFSRGEQTPLLTRYSHPLSSLIDIPVTQGVEPEILRQREINKIERSMSEYVDLVSVIDEESQRTAVATAERIASGLSSGQRNPYAISLAFERYLRDSDTFTYTLNLDFERIPGVDPIEQFLAVDRKGHCQYYASALVMMLRSQRIPARIVAGYHTDEFNELGGYYTARQLHAHAWVEALVPKSSLPKSFVNADGYVPGQLPSDEYWLRLDPTPVAGRENRSQSTGVGQVMDLAKNMWDEYVVDMDGKRQDKALVGNGGKTPMSDSYASLIGYMQLQVSRIRNGELGGGALAGRGVFSLPAAMLGIGLVLVVTAIFRFRFPHWWRSRSVRLGSQKVAQPTIPFYAETLRQLGRLGLQRESGQTPAEFTNATSDEKSHPQFASFAEPLSILTSAFYRYRFGRTESSPTVGPVEPEIESALASVRAGVDRLAGVPRNPEGNES